MSLTVLHRPARTPPPTGPAQPLAVAPPPAPPAAAAGSWVQYALPAVGSLGALVFVLANPRPLFVLGGLLFASTAITVGVALALQQRATARAKAFRERVRYLEHLGSVREQARDVAAAQGRCDAWTHPHPEALWQVAEDPTRLWERRRRDDDALRLRVGRGPTPLPAPLHIEQSGGPLSEVDPVCRQAAEDLVERCATLEDAVLTVDLQSAPAVSVVGPAEASRALVRAAVAQAVTWHAPDDLRVAVLVGPDSSSAWTWVKWLPHCAHPEARDATSQARLFAGDGEELADLLLPELQVRQAERGTPGSSLRRPHLLVVLDTGAATTGHPLLDVVLADAAGLDASVVVLVAGRGDEPSAVNVRMTVGHRELEIEAGGQLRRGCADAIDVAVAEQLARRLSPARLSAASAGGAAAGSPDLVAALGIDPGTLDPARSWAPRPDRDTLRVPIGADSDGRLVHLDLKESAVGGMGPHGLCVGATGSGKSELLRSLVVALAATHSPDRLNLVLVDFKGGATFAGLADLPHVAGMLTNLEDDLALVDRFSDALRGEMQRRQQLLRNAGNHQSVRDYEAARRSGEDLPPLPSLLVVVDEFSELLSAKPEFAEDFVALGRLGRSLGMHLLLASQRLEEGKIRGLESHLSYRIGLRTFSASDSRAVLGVPDAYELPSEPGAAYLKVDTSVWQRLQATYVSGPYVDRSSVAPALAAADRLLPYTANNLALPPLRSSPPTFGSGAGATTTLDVVVGRLRGAAPRAHQVWLPPLAEPATLDELLGEPAVDGRRGLQAGSGEQGTLRAPVGVVDRPRQQRRDPLVVDLSGSGGHLAVVGGPQSGKSTALRTLVTSLALLHTPEELAVHAVDLGGALGGLAGLPHVGTVATRAEPEVVRRLLTQVATALVEREQRLRLLGLDGSTALRRARAEGRLPPGMPGDLLLVIDGWASFRQEFEDLEPTVQAIAARGLALGVHLLLGANRWFDIRPQIKDAIGSRLELRITDKGESEVSRKEAANVPAGQPGRGLASDGAHMQVALPRMDGVRSADGLAAATAQLAADSRQAWPGRPVPPVRMLPGQLDSSVLPPADEDPAPGIPVGLGERDLAPVRIELTGADPHLLVLGDSHAGKTTFLRTLLEGLVARHAPDRARVVLVDYRRTLLGAVPDSHLLAYASSGAACAEVVTDLAGSLQRRLPGADVTIEQLRTRSWWSGPDVYLVVDDHDLVVTPANNPLAPLVELLAQARDIGFHLVVTRRSGGASRAFFEPVLQRLRDLSTPGLLLSGDPAEGPLIAGTKAAVQPPGRGLLVARTGPPQLVQIAQPVPTAQPVGPGSGLAEPGSPART